LEPTLRVHKALAFPINGRLGSKSWIGNNSLAY
jgi:hypothetical protein